MISYDPLSTSNKLNHQESPIQVSEYDTFIKLKSLNSNKSSAPDKIAPWFLKYFAEIFGISCQFALKLFFSS